MVRERLEAKLEYLWQTGVFWLGQASVIGLACILEGCVVVLGISSSFKGCVVLFGNDCSSERCVVLLGINCDLEGCGLRYC